MYVYTFIIASFVLCLFLYFSYFMIMMMYSYIIVVVVFIEICLGDYLYCLSREITPHTHTHSYIPHHTPIKYGRV